METSKEAIRLVNELKKAKNDDEIFAVLLIIAELAKKSRFSPEQRRQIFESIDFEFIKRLVNTREDPEGCEKGTLLAVGLTILLLILRETRLASKEGMMLLLPQLISLINMKHFIYEQSINQLTLEEIQDTAFDSLVEITKTEIGCSHFLKNNGVLALHFDISKNKYKAKKAVQILLTVLVNANTETIANVNATVIEIVEILSCSFCDLQDCNKFVLLDWMTKILMLGREHSLFGVQAKNLQNVQPAFLKKIYRGLMDVLQSKVKKEIKQTSIKLVSLLIDVYGIRRMFSAEEDQCNCSKFLLLLATVASVEISMCLDKLNSDIEILSAAFVVVEHIIGYISENDGTSLSEQSLNADFSSKLFRVIFEIMKTIIAYFKGMLGVVDPMEGCTEVKMIACFRILCAWMCEETMALQDELMEIEPFLLKLAKSSYEKGCLTDSTVNNTFGEPTLFKFLLPVLCHWSADEKFREVLLKEQIQFTLHSYANKLFQQEHLEGREQSLETVLGIFLNLVVTEREIASEHNSIYFEILQLIMTKLPSYLETCKSVSLIANLVTLSLMLSRLHHTELVSKKESDAYNLFLLCSTYFYESLPVKKSGNSSSRYKNEKWCDIEELWLIGMDNLIFCISLFSKLPEVLGSCDSVSKMRQLSSMNKSRHAKDYSALFSAIEQLCNKLPQVKKH